MAMGNFALNWSSFLLATISLTSCGGGSGSAAINSSQVAGVAATGSPIVGTIFLKDSNSNELQYHTTDGSYSFDVTNLTAPFLLKAEWTEMSGSKTYYSFATVTGIANINPLSNIAVMNAAGTSDLSAVYNNPNSNSFETIASNLPETIETLATKLRPLLNNYPDSDINFISDSFSANHLGLDLFFDENSIQVLGEVVTIRDQTSGALAFNANIGNLAQSTVTLNWTNDDALVSESPQVAVDSDGNALVIFTQYVSGTPTIRSKRYTPEDGWSSAVDVGSSGAAAFAQIGMDANGKAIAVWSQYNNNNLGSIWTNSYTSGAGWGTPARIGQFINEASYPKIAVNSAGDAVAVWYEWDGSGGGAGYSVWANHASANSAWGTASMIANVGPNSFRPDVTIDPQGNAIAIWIEGAQPNQDIWSSRYTTLSGWSAPTTIGNHAGDVYAQIQIAADSNGNAIAVWGQYGTAYNMWANYYSAGSGWGTAQKIGGNNDSYHPDLGMDSNGNAIVIWNETDGTQYNLYSNSYTVGSGWSTPELVGNIGDAQDAAIGVDANGGAVALWYGMDLDTFALTIWTNRYVVGTGWSDPSLVVDIDPSITFVTPTPALGVNAAGYSVLVWGLDSW